MSDVSILRSVIRKKEDKINDLKAMVLRLSGSLHVANELIAENSDFDDDYHESNHDLVSSARVLLDLDTIANLRQSSYLSPYDGMEDEEDDE